MPLRGSLTVVGVLAAVALTASGAVAQDVGASAALHAEGVAAASRGEWERAFDKLDQAQTLSPHDPGILYDLGVAHAKAGHEVSAMFWLRAFLLAEPAAAKAPKVFEEVARLEAAARSKEQQLYQTADERGRRGGAARGDDPPAAAQVAFKMASAGHIEDALSHLNGDNADRDQTWFEYARFAALTGDIGSARSALSHIRDVGSWVASYCGNGGGIDPHRWDDIPRSLAEDQFFKCASNVFGPAYPVCPVWQYPFARDAVRTIRDTGLQTEARQVFESLASAREKVGHCASATRLDLWLGYVNFFGAMDLATELEPKHLLRRTFDDEGQAPGAIAGVGSEIGRQLALYHTLDGMLSRVQ